MRFIGRSREGTLTVYTVFIFLLCIVLFMLFSWILLAVYSRNEATSTARSHLTFIKQAYQAHSDTLKDDLGHVATNADLIATLKQQPASLATQSHLQSLLVGPFSRNSLAAIALVSSKYQVLAQMSDTTLSAQDLASQAGPLLAQGLQGQTLSSLQRSIPGTGGADWSLSVAIPVRASSGATLGVLLAFQAIDNNFAHLLTQDVGTPTLFCIGGQVQGTSGTSLQSLSLSENGGAGKVCTAGTSLKLGQHYLTLAGATAGQNIDAAQLVVVAVEPLYIFNGTDTRFLLIIAGLGLFISGMGILAYVFMKHFLFTKPLHQLLAHVQPLVMNTVEQQVEQGDDEITQLTQSFNLLADELENESQAMAEQMSNLLIASDALISTLNLEHLLGEIVTRLGNIMKVKHVSLLLYGREMLSPWAVAQWSEVAGQIVDAHSAPNSLFSHSLQQQGAVTVHADPDADITLAITSKMAAITNARLTRASGKRKAVQGDTAETQSYGLRRPRIPRLAVRDLDQVLSHMVIQRHKIAYGEDIASIDREHQGKWTRMALEAGYRSAIAVPLLLHDQAIGAFMLYTDTPRQISSRDTFLLSTVTAQTAVAIQNALLFAEVKEKNAALERASHLKSQFLANVTHELRTPLHSIISYGDFMLEGYDGKLLQEQEEHVQLIVNRAEDLSHLVDDMLDLSKIEADRIEVKLEAIELQPCLMEVVDQIKPMANKKGLYLNLVIDDRMPLIKADSHRLRQVALNLVSNALKFTERGGITIRCRLVHDDKMVRISVSDTGIGISPSALTYIFEAFRQEDGSTTRRFGGTGLGLTIARKLTELQGGDFAVESIPGQGSTFSFTLPVEAASRVGSR